MERVRVGEKVGQLHVKFQFSKPAVNHACMKGRHAGEHAL